MTTAVMAWVRTLGGREEEDEILMSFCQIAVEELTGKLKAGLTVADCGSAFAIGAAWLAISYLEYGTGSVKSFSVGDFSVSQQESSGARGQMLRMMAPYIQGAEFAFCSVEG